MPCLFRVAVLTGSRKHLHELQGIASANGLALTDAGLLRGTRIFPTKTKEQVYAALSLPFIAPEFAKEEGKWRWRGPGA